MLLNGGAFATDDLTKLEQLVSQSNYQQAWQQAKKLAKTYEGDLRFDYLYGVSALETGHYDLAVFGLERVVINKPRLIRPRLELARAYLKIDNNIAALHEFTEVLRLKPPVKVRDNVNRYIQAMKKSGGQKWIVDGLLSLTTGYDSNANFGAETSVFDTPVFGSVILNDRSTKQDSPFAELSTQLNARYTVSEKHTWFLNGRVNHKHFSDVKAFNASGLSLQGGSLFAVGRQKYQLYLRHKIIHIDDHAFSKTFGLQAGIKHQLASSKVLSAGLFVEDYDHKQQNLRDAHRYGVSGGYRFSANHIGHQLGFSLGHERPKKRAGKQYTRNTLGGAYSAEYLWNDSSSSFISTQLQYRKHRAFNPIYAKKRKDKRLLFKIGHSIRMDTKWSVFANIGYTKNNSNLDLYDTNKTLTQMGVNYNF